MSSNYNTGIGNHCNDDEYEYFSNGVKVSNAQSFPSAFNRNHESLKSRFRSSRGKYEDIDCEFELLSNFQLSDYRKDNELNQHHIQQHNHYHQKQQLYRDHQPNYYNVNSDKHASLHISSKKIPPPTSVQHHHIGKSQNNNYQTSGDRFIGEPQPQTPLESSRLPHSGFDYCDSLSEDHYQHYYSYFYDRIPNIRKNSSRRRNLPSTRNMPSSKNNLQSSEALVIDKYGLLSDQSNFDDRSDMASPYENHVLKEKAANNNKESSYGNGSWHYDSLNTTAIDGAGDYVDTKAKVTHEYKISKYYEDAKSIGQSFTSKSNGRRLNTYSNDHTQDPYIRSANVCNNNRDQLIRQHKSVQEDENGKRSIQLPVSPVLYTGSLKKPSPPAKSRRVLIYNSQSPRVSNLLTHKRVQRSRSKSQGESQVDDSPQKAIDNRTRGLKSTISNKHVNGTNDNKNTFENNNFSSEESDSEFDLDNASDFDESAGSDISSDSEECYRSHAYKLTHSFDAVSATVSVVSSINSMDNLSNPEALLVPSLFPNVPPYLAFSSNAKKGPDVPADLYRILKWRVTSVMPRVVRTILANSGMRLLKKTNDWMGVWGKHMKSPCFKTVRPYQKINHLPGSFKIGRKDSCWKNLVKQMAKHGKKEFGFMPKTYIIPNDLKQLRKSWPKYSQRNVKWIIKPPASARGSGIRVVDRWAQIPKRKSLIVQKYIERPLLINGSKFDLRLYVLVTSMNPLRVYMYHNGLARFASVKYSDKSDTLSDRCMHLTNYSINKFSSNYSKNEDVNACHGHKWTIKSLWNYLANRGVRTELLWEALRSLVLRTILAGENSINNMIRTNVESKYSCFELFGFDVLLDADLVPWLLEVNISPSLHSELPLDAHVKAPLVQSVLNTALYNIPPKISIERQKEIATEMSLPPGPICYDKRMYINYLSRSEKIKHSTFTRKTIEDRHEYIGGILDHLTPDDVRCLIIAEDELARSSPLERIFPTAETHKYLKYTETPRYYNRLLDAWETRYGSNRAEGITVLRQYCEERYHLQVPQLPTKKPLKYRTRAIMKINRPTSLALTASSNSKWKSHGQKLRAARAEQTISNEECEMRK